MEKRNKIIEIDISGQIQQLNYDSACGFRRQKYAYLLIKKDMIEDVLFKFKRR